MDGESDSDGGWGASAGAADPRSKARAGSKGSKGSKSRSKGSKKGKGARPAPGSEEEDAEEDTLSLVRPVPPCLECLPRSLSLLQCLLYERCE